MSVITTLSTKRKTAGSTREASEFDGLWMNPGVLVPSDVEGEEPSFLRLPRGIAISDLKPTKIYESMSPDFAAKAAIMNTVISEIQNAAKTLGEGESMPITMELVLYRRQEESNVVADKETNDSVRQALFGTK